MIQTIPNNLSVENLKQWLTNDPISPFVIDVRECAEVALAPFPNSDLNLPLSKSEEWIESLRELIPANRKIVVLCHKGVRSWHFCSWLIEQEFEQEIWNLDGGIDSWSLNIDCTIPRY